MSYVLDFFLFTAVVVSLHVRLKVLRYVMTTVFIWISININQFWSIYTYRTHSPILLL